jgi:predicted nucleotidyltransferase
MKTLLPAELIALIRKESSEASPAELNLLTKAILKRHGETVQAILFYGSCLRTGNAKEGIVDLYVIVDSYRSANRNPLWAMLNWLLPPNVFYLEVSDGDEKIRTKYAVLTIADFKRGTSNAWFHSYLWTRFAQPVRLAYVVSEEIQHQINHALAQAVVTFLNHILPQVSPRFNARDLWSKGFSLSYRSELRPEKKDQPLRLFEGAQEYYDQVTQAATSALPFELECFNPVCYRSHISTGRRLFSHLTWQFRFAQGKCLSVLRLLKGLFTFEGGLDYILWKIERHSGVSVPKDAILQEHPVCGIFLIFWQLYRRGGFR